MPVIVSVPTVPAPPGRTAPSLVSVAAPRLTVPLPPITPVVELVRALPPVLKIVPAAVFIVPSLMIPVLIATVPD